MFSGIIEEIGTVKRVIAGGNAGLVVRCATVLDETRLGDSIAVNGVCLTVAARDRDTFTANVQPITFRRSNLGELRVGDQVNLERSVAIGQRIGGHYVQGHVDGVGRVIRSTGEGAAVVVRLTTPSEILRYVVERGFVAVDGASLTVARLYPDGFEVSLVYHTQQHITLSAKSMGALINLEVDVVAKYVERLTGGGVVDEHHVTNDLLRQHGFA
jgi:riboflavin synthase